MNITEIKDQAQQKLDIKDVYELWNFPQKV